MKFKLLILGMFVIGAFLRLYNFENRLVFGPEQAISLMNSAANLEKFSLLGEYNLQRTTSTGLNLIHGPLFSYFLLPFIVVFNYRVFPISLVFPILNLLTALALFMVTSKLFGKLIAALSLSYFLFSSLMIYHSLFIWIYNPIPLLGVLTVWFFSRPSTFWLGVVSGIGFSLQYPYLFFALFTLGLICYLSARKARSILVFSFGFLLANFTKVIFDFRHEFFHLKVFWQFFLDVYVRHSVTAPTYYYHYLQLFPIFCIIIAFLTVGLYKINKFVALLALVLYLFVNLKLPLLNLKKPVGMPAGITLRTLENAANFIAKDNPPAKFNLVTLWDFDTRANPLRYLMKYYYQLTPAGYENYNDVDILYAFAPENYDIVNPHVWELTVFHPYQVTDLKINASGYRLYKLSQ